MVAMDCTDVSSNLLELAANDDADGLHAALARAAADEPARWLCRVRAAPRPAVAMLLRTPLMVASTYGSLGAMRVLLALGADPNRASPDDGATALHCAAAGGSAAAISAAKLLLASGADPNLLDAAGLRPADAVPPLPHAPAARIALEDLLGGLRVSTSSSSSSSSSMSPPSSGSPDGEGSGSPSSGSASSPVAAAKKEYPVDPSLPDIKNSLYATDEFRMFSFKVRPCSRAYSHDWTECPFVHPGENARRRDPRKFHYSCVPCPDFRKGACRRGDLCEYAHGVFECWLHPAQYRTRLCKDGTACARRVCFFAHTQEELRPLFVSTGSAVPSPRAVDLVGPPGSPSSHQFTPPMSPTGSAWPAPAVPALHLPGSSLSRLRTSLHARDLPPDELSLLEAQQLLGDYSACFSSPRLRKAVPVAPANLDELFDLSASPRLSADQQGVFSPTAHKPAVLQQLQQHPSLLSPAKTGNGYLPAATFGLPAAPMSPRGLLEPGSPLGARLAAVVAQREKQLQLQQLRGMGPPSGASSPWARWGGGGSPVGRSEWAVDAEELGRLRRSNSFESGEEPDVSWVQSLVRESPPEAKEKSDAGEQAAVLAAWLDHMQMDHGLPT